MSNRALACLLLILLCPPQARSDPFSTDVERAIETGKQGNLNKAIEDCRRLALSKPKHPNAPPAHMAAIVFAASALGKATEPEQEEAANKYRTLLEEHRQTWPESESAAKAGWWLARNKLASSGRESVADALRLVPAPNPHHAEAVAAVQTLYDDALEAAAEPTQAALLRDARKHLQPLITGDNNQWPSEWSAAQIAVGEKLAEWHLRYHPTGSKYALRVLTAIDDLMGFPETCRLSNRGIVLLGAARMLQAETIFDYPPVGAKGIPFIVFRNRLAERMNESYLRDLLLYLDLMEYQEHGFSDRGRTIAQEVLDVAFFVRSMSGPAMEKLEHEEKVALARHIALATEFLGDRINNGLIACDRWIKLSPDDPEAYETKARILSTAKGHNYLNQAIRAWQAIEQQSKPGGERWRRARDARTRTLRKLGQTEEADKLQSLTELLYPVSPPIP